MDLSAKSVLFTWVFLRTRGSALVAVLLHGTTNLFEVSAVVESTEELAYPMLAAAGKWVIVAILVAWAGPRLTRRPSPKALAQPAEQAH